mgnify:CR=1 FL=1
MSHPQPAESETVHFGRRIPVRGIVSTFIVTGAVMLFVTVLTLVFGRPELAAFALLFLLIPVIAVPAIVLLNTFAEFSPATGMISVNGRAATPLAALIWCNYTTFRGTVTFDIGYGPRRTDRFGVSSQSPFASPRIERDWMRFILPFTGLRRDPTGPQRNPWGAAGNESVTFEQAVAFSVEQLQ